MPKPVSEEVKHQWKENILKQRASGISVRAWCHQNDVTEHAFIYWQKKFFPKSSLKRSDFTEFLGTQKINLPEKSSGIFFECQGICIHVEKQFDLLTLQQCLNALKGISC